MARGKGKASRIAVWVILALLVVGLIGFGTDNFGGGARSVAAVGGREITSEAYARALQAELREVQQATGEPVTMAQLRAAGRDHEVLGRLLAQAALDHEARALGLSAGDARVRELLMREPAFQGAAGQFDPEGYRFVLERAGITEAQFEADLRDEAARGLLLTGVAGAVEAPRGFVDAVLGHLGETRDLAWIALDEAALREPVPDPEPAALAAWHEANADAFTLPETRVITYASLSPEALAAGVTVPEAEVRALYDARRSEFVRPERRLLERLVFPDEAQAQAAAERIAAGEASFDDLVAARGLSPDDVDLGDVARERLGPAAEAVFARPEPGVVGPLPTDLGPALFRVNAILDASEVAFETVEAELRASLAGEAARREVGARAIELDDLLAGGAEIEELGEMGLEVATVRLPAGAGAPGLPSEPAFLEAAAAAGEGDFPQMLATADGGLFALRLDEVVAPRVPALEEVRDAAVAGWREAETRARLAALAEGLREPFAAGRTIGGPGVSAGAREGVGRDEAVEGAPAGLVAAAFEAEAGGTAVVADAVPVVLLRVDAVAPPDPSAPRNALIAAALGAQAEQGLASDLAAAFVRALQAEAGISLDQGALVAVTGQF